MNKTIYVTGHKHPDTDSICAAITYADILHKLGEQAIACRQGPLNEETKFVLKRFHQENPLLLTDARAKLEDISLDEPTIISEKSTVHHAWHVMLRTQNRSLFVVNDEGQLTGVCTTSNLSAYRLKAYADITRLMSYATLDDIAHTIGGEIVYQPDIFKTNGSVHIITLEGQEAIEYDLKDGISILSGNSEKQKILIEEGVKCLVVTCGVKTHEDVIELAKKYECAIIETKEDTMHTSTAIIESYAIKHVMTKEVISFQKSEYVNDVASKMTKSRVRSYPVLDEEGNIVGAISRYHTLNYNHRKFVLVDHSAINQTINHIEEADIEAIIDHHHIGDITTDHPIMYRNVKCGCTCTIIAQIYQENGLLPSADMSGLLLSAILSDTLNLKSATTTRMDCVTVQWLAKLAGIENVDDYAREMLGASVDLKNSKPEDIFYRDLKNYEIGNYKVAIGQTNYSHMEEVQLILPAFKSYLEKEQQDKHYDLSLMLFTDVMGEGSIFVYYGPLSQIITDTIETSIDEHYGFDSTIISRKQQLIPKLSAIIKTL